MPFGRKVHREAATQLVNHKDTNTIVTRMGVTSSWYRKWSETARSLSNAMTVTFRKDAKARSYWKYKSTIKTVGQKKAKSSPLDAIFNITALIIAVISCEHNPTARSEKARLRNSFLTVAGIVEFFIKARMTKRFPRVATRENTKFKTQKPRKKLLLWETSVIQKSRNRVHFCSAIVLLFMCNMHVFVVVKTDSYSNYPSVY